MLQASLTRLLQGHRTIKFPKGAPPEMPDRFRGRPALSTKACPPSCTTCAEACPTSAIALGAKPKIDLGKCLFCLDCQKACPQSAIAYSSDYRISARRRQDLVADFAQSSPLEASALNTDLKKLFGRSLKLRQVSAGGCNACEADVNVLGTIGWDLGRFGIQMVASPRHADGLLITGPVTKNMELALRKTYDAMAEPKLVIAVGSCAISGGPYLNHEQTRNGAEGMVPIDLYIPGCPPHPLTILDGLLRLIGRINDNA
jgi:Ni,Fe-hydrogenase III small subunit/ferredoxin